MFWRNQPNDLFQSSIHRTPRECNKLDYRRVAIGYWQSTIPPFQKAQGALRRKKILESTRKRQGQSMSFPRARCTFWLKKAYKTNFRTWGRGVKIFQSRLVCIKDLFHVCCDPRWDNKTYPTRSCMGHSLMTLYWWKKLKMRSMLS